MMKQCFSRQFSDLLVMTMMLAIILSYSMSGLYAQAPQPVTLAYQGTLIDCCLVSVTDQDEKKKNFKN